MTDTIKNLFLSMSAAAFFTLAVLSIPSHSADLKGPAARVDAQGNEKPMFQGCYAGAGAAGFFIDGEDSVKAFAIGGGCDLQRGRVVFGLGGNYIIGKDDLRAVDLHGRIGYALNPHLLLYIKGGILTNDDFKLGDAAVMVGGGLETYLDKNITLFLEASTNAKEWGDMRGMPDSFLAMIGARYRF